MMSNSLANVKMPRARLVQLLGRPIYDGPTYGGFHVHVPVDEYAYTNEAAAEIQRYWLMDQVGQTLYLDPRLDLC